MENCAHGRCTCRHDPDEMVERDGALYCSESCARPDPDATSCDCGHPECRG